MASNMSLHEKLDTLLNHVQTVIIDNASVIRRSDKLIGRSAYLCKQRDKQNQGALNSPPPTLKPRPPDTIRCSKCQGFGHSLSDCVNQKYVTLAEWTAMIKEELPVARFPPCIEEDLRMYSMVEQKEVVEKTENPSKLHKHTPPHTFPDKLEPCGVVEEFEPPLPQQASLPSQQELRTILFEEGENDVHVQRVHFLFPNSPSWESSSMQTHAWPYSFVTLLFEFHDKRHVMEFYLARKELRTVQWCDWNFTQQ